MKAAPTITDAQLRRIVLDQANGVSAGETAAALDLSPKKVSRIRSSSSKQGLRMRDRLGLMPPRDRSASHWRNW
jgi:hypothetical protein